MVDMIAKTDLATAPKAARPFLERFLNLIKDEPWVFGVPVGGEREFIAGCGLELRDLLTIGGEESLKRYVTKSDGTQLGAAAIAAGLARFAQRAREAGESLPQMNMSPEQRREQQRLMAYQLAEAVVA